MLCNLNGSVVISASSSSTTVRGHVDVGVRGALYAAQYTTTCAVHGRSVYRHLPVEAG